MTYCYFLKTNLLTCVICVLYFVPLERDPCLDFIDYVGQQLELEWITEFHYMFLEPRSEIDPTPLRAEFRYRFHWTIKSLTYFIMKIIHRENMFPYRENNPKMCFNHNWFKWICNLLPWYRWTRLKILKMLNKVYSFFK